MRIGLRHIGQPQSNDATVSAQLPQNRECPQGTRATPSRGCSRQTSHELQVSAEAGTLSTPSACEGVAWSVSASSATSLSAGSDSSELWSGICRGWACTMLRLTARRNCIMCTDRCHTSHSTSASKRRSSYNASWVDAGSAVRCLRAVDRSCSPWVTRWRWPKNTVSYSMVLHAQQLSSFMSVHVCSQLTTKARRNRRRSFIFRSCIFWSSISALPQLSKTNVNNASVATDACSVAVASRWLACR